MTSLHQTSETAPTAPPRWFTPGVRGIGLASFLADVGHEIPTALFASLVTIALGAPASILGLLEGLADGLAELARFVEGPLADTLTLPPASSPEVISCAQRAHYRLTFQERLARNRRVRWRSRRSRVPDPFAAFLGLQSAERSPLWSHHAFFLPRTGWLLRVASLCPFRPSFALA